MHIKRGLVFALSLFLIIVLVALVTSLEIAGPATWRNVEGNNITGETITIDLSQGVPVGQPTYNMLVDGITGVLPGEDYVTFEIWEKDTHEGAGNDPIRTHDLGNEITGSYSNGQASGSWFLALADFDLAGTEEDGIYEMFYKMIIGPEGATSATRGSAIGSYDNVLLNFRIIWPGSMIDPSLYWWGGPYSNGGITEPIDPPTVLQTRIVDAQDLFNSNDNRLSNTIYPVLDGIEIPEGGEGEQSQVYFEIWSDACDNRDYPIRVEENAISAIVQRGDTFATGPWFISLQDILNSPPHCGESCYEQSQVYYRYTFDATFAGQGGVCIENPPLVDVFINWTGFSFPERWLDRNAGLEITDLDLVTATLGTEESQAYIEITGLPAGTLPNGETGTTEGMEVYVELWELDNPHDWFSLIGEDADSDGIDDAIRTVANGKALTGTVDSTGKVLIPIIFKESDFLGHEKEQTYEFHFTLSFVGTKGQIIPIPHGNNLLRVSLDGDVQGCDVSGASGEWRYLSDEKIGDTLMTFDPLGQSTLKVRSYSSLPCEEGTPVTIEIYEHDSGTENDAIRTTDPLTGVPLYGVVDSNGEVRVSWTVTQEDIDAARLGGENDDIYEFYFKIIVGEGEKDFSDELLYVWEREDSCLTVNTCGDYFGLAECNADGCEVANDTGLIFNPPIECELLGLNCWCGWNNITSSCEFYWNNPSDPPSPFNDQCNYPSDPGTDTCEDDGYLSFTWTAEIIWDTSNSFSQAECEAYATTVGGTSSDCVFDQGAWRYDPGYLTESCEGGSNTILCPARVQLSFWDWRNLVIVVLAIVIIYLIIEINNRNKEKKKVTKKK